MRIFSGKGDVYKTFHRGPGYLQIVQKRCGVAHSCLSTLVIIHCSKHVLMHVCPFTDAEDWPTREVPTDTTDTTTDVPTDTTDTTTDADDGSGKTGNDDVQTEVETAATAVKPTSSTVYIVVCIVLAGVLVMAAAGYVLLNRKHKYTVPQRLSHLTRQAPRQTELTAHDHDPSVSTAGSQYDRYQPRSAAGRPTLEHADSRISTTTNTSWLELSVSAAQTTNVL